MLIAQIKADAISQVVQPLHLLIQVYNALTNKTRWSRSNSNMAARCLLPRSDLEVKTPVMESKPTAAIGPYHVK
jgi:hypothetical protein